MYVNMLKFVSNHPISRRLFVAFTLAALLPGILIAIMGFYYINSLNARGAATSAISRAQLQTDLLASNMQSMYNQTQSLEATALAALASHTSAPSSLQSNIDAVSSTASGFANKILAYQNQFDPINSQYMQPVASLMSSIDPNNGSPNNDTNTLHEITNSTWNAYLTAQQQELQLITTALKDVNSGRLTSAQAASQITIAADKLSSVYTILDNQWSQIISDVDNIDNSIDSANANQAQPVLYSTILAFLLSFILVTVSGIVVQRSITGPLTELVSLTKRISKGETNARAHVSSRDEIAIVANSMNSMLDNIVHLIQDTQSQRDVLQGQVEKLVGEVSGVGEGDLRVQAEVTADALGVLADSFNYMVEELGSLVVRVKKVARDVQQSTSLTSDRMNILVETADQQIAQIENAALEIEHMAQTGLQVANRAQELASSAREARLSAQDGRQALQQTIEGMGRIQTNVAETSNRVQMLGERSREINNIVEAISTIAHQTNRLALDAAIQAAMAGDNGKGFGAVAADIRRLAERAKEEVGSIGQIIRSVRDEIEAVATSMSDTERETAAGAQMAREAGTSLGEIFSVVERQAREIDVINQMATQQQQSSGDVVQIMQVVSESTQASSASTRDAAQNMERVALLAEQLLASVEAFKLRDNLNYTAPGDRAISLTEVEAAPPALNNSFRTVMNGSYLAGPNSGVFTPVNESARDDYAQQFSPALPYQSFAGQQAPFPATPTPMEQDQEQEQLPFPTWNVASPAFQLPQVPPQQTPRPPWPSSPDHNRTAPNSGSDWNARPNWNQSNW
jgi:methyl-accepting chemotaxis protein